MKKKILILMMEAGNGHKIPALAIQKYIQSNYPGEYSIRIIDFAKDLDSRFADSFCKILWKFCLKFPVFFSMIYKLFDFKHVKYINIIFGRKLIFKLNRFIRRFDPCLIVSTHFISSTFLAFLKSRGQLNVPCVSINIEPYESHNIWVHPELETIVFSKKARKEQIKRGVKKPMVKLFNYCLRSDFSIKLPSKKEIRKRLNLDPEKFTLLLVSGGEGIGNIGDILKNILKAKLDVQVLVVTGRNKKLFNYLTKLTQANHRIRIFGYVNSMEKLLKASDLVCGKSGPNVTFEALALRKPLLYTSSMKNEEPVKRFVVNHNLGWSIGPNRLNDFLQRILVDKSEFNRVQSNVNSFGFRSGTKDVSKYLLSLIK